MSRIGIFLDRDGTLIHDRDYLFDPAGVELIPGVAAALATARRLGYRLFIHTNQSGIARGLYAMDAVIRCNDRMDELLGLPRPIFDFIEGGGGEEYSQRRNMEAFAETKLVTRLFTECRKRGATRADILAFEFEMGLFPAVLKEAKDKGIDAYMGQHKLDAIVFPANTGASIAAQCVAMLSTRTA